MKKDFWKPATFLTCGLTLVWFVSSSTTPIWSQGEGGNFGQNQFLSANRALASAQVASAGTAMMASVILANGFQQLAVVDHAKTTIAVYHIDPVSGDIQLKSVRRFDADFLLEEFNLSEPTPSTIRKNVR